MVSNIKYEDKPWIAHYDHGVPEKIDYEPICLTEYLELSVNRFPERTALILEGFKIKRCSLRKSIHR
jgi:long-chain acyl-CoA synthetase